MFVSHKAHEKYIFFCIVMIALQHCLVNSGITSIVFYFAPGIEVMHMLFLLGYLLSSVKIPSF